jgi:lipid A 3-O-deacylase
MKSPLRLALSRVPLLLSLLLCGPAAAQPPLLGPPQRIAANLGGFEVLDGVSAYEVGWELRFAPRRFPFLPRWVPGLMPTAGVMASSRGVLFPYAGLRLDLPLGDRWVASPGWATGIYYRDHGKNLGGALEFRSHFELAYRLPADGRIGLCFYHLSNGGLFDFNPGTESLVLTYSARLRN